MRTFRNRNHAPCSIPAGLARPPPFASALAALLAQRSRLAHPAPEVALRLVSRVRWRPGSPAPTRTNMRCWGWCRAPRLCSRSHAAVRRSAVVFAHSVLPQDSLRGGWNGITRLGSRSLGEALFSDHRIERQPLPTGTCETAIPCFAPLLHSSRFRLAACGRAALCFCLGHHPLLVTEVFLPAIDAL